MIAVTLIINLVIATEKNVYLSSHELVHGRVDRGLISSEKASRAAFRQLLNDSIVWAISLSWISTLIIDIGFLSCMFRSFSSHIARPGQRHHISDAPLTHVRTSPYYPQSNGKIERWHREFKETVISPRQPESLEKEHAIIMEWIHYYNNVRLHSALAYIAPINQLEGRAAAIFAAREEMLEAAREQRRLNHRDVAMRGPECDSEVPIDNGSSER